MMQSLPQLKIGDSVELIAPASRCEDADLRATKNLLESWQLNCIISHDIFGKDLLCANTDDYRFKALKQALYNPEVKAVICVRGGYGSMRLIPKLASLKPPTNLKLFMGMSDITALNTFLQQQWQWPVLHAAIGKNRSSPESIHAIQSILFGNTDKIEFQGFPYNTPAKKKIVNAAKITGGNLCIIQAGVGTNHQINCEQKILFLEEVDERGYRLDRMLEHLQQANIFKKATAVILGDFIGGNEPDGSSLIDDVLKRFAAQLDIPVVKINGVGHGLLNYPMPLGTHAILSLGNKIKLTCFR